MLFKSLLTFHQFKILTSAGALLVFKNISNSFDVKFGCLEICEIKSLSLVLYIVSTFFTSLSPKKLPDFCHSSNHYFFKLIY